MLAGNAALTLTSSARCTVAVPARRFISPIGGLPTAGGQTLGVTVANFDIGDYASAEALGVLIVEAGMAVAVGARVETDATGRAVTKAAGQDQGLAITAATAAGEMIRILRGA